MLTDSVEAHKARLQQAGFEYAEVLVPVLQLRFMIALKAERRNDRVRHFYRHIAKVPSAIGWISPAQLSAWQRESLHGKFKQWF